jgi:hypothetical protein
MFTTRPPDRSRTRVYLSTSSCFWSCLKTTRGPLLTCHKPDQNIALMARLTQAVFPRMTTTSFLPSALGANEFGHLNRIPSSLLMHITPWLSMPLHDSTVVLYSRGQWFPLRTPVLCMMRGHNILAGSRTVVFYRRRNSTVVWEQCGHEPAPSPAYEHTDHNA